MAATIEPFSQRLRAAMRRNKSLVCVGLDPNPDNFPQHLGNGAGAIAQFNATIVDATSDLVCAYKPNLGFYAAHGEAGFAALVETRRLIPAGIPVILDAKVGDMDATSAAYARGYFDLLGFDAITVHPFMGEDGLSPFLIKAGRCVFVLCKTSNPGGGEFQDLMVREGARENPFFLTVAAHAADWATRSAADVGLVVGATYPDHLARVRAACPNLPILVPGVGAQAGDLAATVRAGLDARGEGLIVSASRSILYAGDGPDFAAQARAATLHLRDEINILRDTAAVIAIS